MSKPNHQCPNCGHAFNLEQHIDHHVKGEIAYLQTPNTFTGYPEMASGGVLRCPKCKQLMMYKDYEPPKQN